MSARAEVLQCKKRCILCSAARNIAGAHNTPHSNGKGTHTNTHIRTHINSNTYIHTHTYIDCTKLYANIIFLAEACCCMLLLLPPKKLQLKRSQAAQNNTRDNLPFTPQQPPPCTTLCLPHASKKVKQGAKQSAQRGEQPNLMPTKRFYWPQCECACVWGGGCGGGHAIAQFDCIFSRPLLTFFCIFRAATTLLQN